MKNLVLATLVCLCVLVVGAQAESNPLSLGTVTPGTILGSCSGSSIPNSSMFGSNMICQDITVTCPTIQQQQVQPLHAIFGYYAPTTGSKGTIVLFSGGDGTMPQGPSGEEVQYANYYEGQGFTVVQIEWASAWEDPSNGSGTNNNILAAACRPATFLNWISGNPTTHPQGTAFCGQGASAGGTGFAYPLAYYGASNWSGTGSSPLSPLKNVELISGPVLSEIDEGCTNPNALTMTICAPGQYGCTAKTVTWTNNVIYVDGYATAVSNWSGISGCAQPGGQGGNNLSNWKAMSIVDGGINGVTPTFSYPNISMHGWVCQSYATDPVYHFQECFPPHCPNNSASQGNYFYQQFSSTQHPASFKLTGVQACFQEEGVSQGTDPDTPGGTGSAMTSIETDMITNCPTN